jgi:hypothetical protein
VPLYFANPSTPGVRAAMREGLIGAITTPRQGNDITGMPAWCADNGCFGKGYVGDGQFLGWLLGMRPESSRCWFAVCPDVPFDAAATLARFSELGAVVRACGYPVALAAQNGLEDMTVPWDGLDVLFLGGDTAWKLGPAARRLTAEARERGKGVHMGRVNSLRRYRYASAIGCTSVDGTYLAFGPDANLPKLLGWVRDIDGQGALFGADAA